MTEILRRHAFSITFLAILLAFALLWRSDGEIQRFSGYTMGTTWDVQLVDVPDDPGLEQIRSEVDALLTHLDAEVFSTYADDSELSRLNRHPVNTAFPASAALFEVLEMAVNISRTTDGAFDVTVGPLVNLWGFGPDQPDPASPVPDEEALREAWQGVGYQYLKLETDDRLVSKTRALYIDLSAIAKGYAVDRVGDYFDSLGIDSYFVEVGGELKMRGLKPGGQSWIPAIETPVDSASQIYEIFFSHGETIAVAGSGDYRNYFEVGGVRYSHEIDPRTGRPITHNLGAVYVIDASAARADALATAFMIMGLEEGRELATQISQPVYFIYRSAGQGGGFEDYVSPEFEYYLRNQD